MPTVPPPTPYATCRQGVWRHLHYFFGKDKDRLSLLPHAHWYAVKQVHGTEILEVEGKAFDKASTWLPSNEIFSKASAKTGHDALYTVSLGEDIFNDSEKKLKDLKEANTDKGVVAYALIIKTADCLPVLLSSNKDSLGFAAAIHCGWRSLAGGILQQTLLNIAKRIAVKNAESDWKTQIQVSLGPSIGRCCYQVREDLLCAFKPILKRYKLSQNNYFFVDKKNPDRKPTANLDDGKLKSYRFSLASLAKDILIEEGIKRKNINAISHCTACDARYYSHRENGTKLRNYSVLYLEKKMKKNA